MRLTPTAFGFLKISLASVMAAAVLTSCNKSSDSAANATPTPDAQPPTPTPTPRPTPTPVPTGPPTPTPIVRHFAPEGVFFVTEDVSVPIPGGLMGVPPGTQVKLVKEAGDSATVTDGSHQFNLKASQLTNDLDEAAKIQKGVQSAEAAGEAYRLQQQAAYEKQQKAQIDFLRAHPLGGGVTPTPPH